MVELVAFLRACLSDDERLARAATEGPWRYNPRKEWNGPPLALGVLPEPEEYVAAGPMEAPVCVAATGPSDDEQSMADARHIASWDPSRVLAEVEAKRRVITIWETQMESYGADAAEEAVRALAQPFSDRPGFRDEWRLT